MTMATYRREVMTTGRSMSRLLAALVTAIGLLAAVPASAQDDGRGFRIKSKPTDHRQADPERPTTFMQAMAACMARKSDMPVKLMRTVPASEEEHALIAQAKSRLNRCLPDSSTELGEWLDNKLTTTVSFDIGLLRGTLAEALVERKYKTQLAEVASGSRSLVSDEFSPERFYGTRSSDIERMFSQAFAGCVVGTDAAGAARLLATESETPEERQAIHAIIPALSSCVMQGQTLKVDPPALRASLAEAVYYALEYDRPVAGNDQ